MEFSRSATEFASYIDTVSRARTRSGNRLAFGHSAENNHVGEDVGKLRCVAPSERYIEFVRKFQ